VSLTEFFYSLTPNKVLDAVEVDGRVCTGRFIVLNSYENRVYQLELDDGRFVVAKFYRPGRWSTDAILDEHDFLLDLEEAEVEVAAPLELPDGDTLDEIEGIKFAIFPRYGGRAPEEMTDDQLRQMGRLLARIHAVGKSAEAEDRLTMAPGQWLLRNLDVLIEHDLLPLEVRERYAGAVHALHDAVLPLWEDLELHRIHGDVHLGNLLRSPHGFVFLDFDDMVMGPAVQDLWMLQGGRDAWAQRRLELMLEGYTSMLPFDRRQLALIEPLRAMRMVHFAAWIARRWEDPAFPQAFPDFGTRVWWDRETRELTGQLAEVRDAALRSRT